jgi:hypothetical protein
MTTTISEFTATSAEVTAQARHAEIYLDFFSYVDSMIPVMAGDTGAVLVGAGGARWLLHRDSTGRPGWVATPVGANDVAGIIVYPDRAVWLSPAQVTARVVVESFLTLTRTQSDRLQLAC